MTRRETLLVVDDEPYAVAIEGEILEGAGFEVLPATSAEQAGRLLDQCFVDLVLADQRLGRSSGTSLLASCRRKFPGLGGILITGHADVDCAVAAMRAGALDLLQKPVDKEILLEAVSRALDESRLVREVRHERWKALRENSFPDIIGQSPALLAALNVARQVTPTLAAVLIQGESGTGKELVARAIHAGGPRASMPFVAVNAGAIPQSLMESTLFGSKKGSYTDAKTDQRGIFEAANGGTVFLDEVGETTPEVQVRLLRVLQEKVITRVGETAPRDIDVRVIAATNRDLRSECDKKSFRLDLYYRLAVISVSLPPLRERAGDIDLLANSFLENRGRELGRLIRGITGAALEKLRSYAWPGNVRELDNVIQRAIILSTSEIITPESLMLDDAGPRDSALDKALTLPFREAEQAFEAEDFAALLRRTGGNKTRAAELAEIDRTVLHAHLKKIGDIH